MAHVMTCEGQRRCRDCRGSLCCWHSRVSGQVAN